MALKYKRILLKLSGEVLKGSSDSCHDEAILAEVAKRLAELVALGAEVGVVIGGGNIFRGLTGARNGTDRVRVASAGYPTFEISLDSLDEREDDPITAALNEEFGDGTF